MDDGFNPLQSKPQRNKKRKGEYPCKECEYVATQAGNLKTHIESKHEGVRYLCSKCEYAATTASYLQRHFKSNHDGVRYPCSQCEYIATTTSNLMRHVENKHEGVRLFLFSMRVFCNYSRVFEGSC